eukprot:gb/GFBE01019815.1/.p1 GENE.gb/GFBE01019815.1/~~gb/GFBE01019815.1/.p1  ORF type:complete len:357 (+),score=70.78 gb/GFBE01019815.1/:1-1071(+)
MAPPIIRNQGCIMWCAGIEGKGALIQSWKMCRKAVVPCIAGSVAGLAAGGLKAVQNYYDAKWIEENIAFESTAYATFGTVLGFLIVFRTAQSYNRFWMGIELAFIIAGHWQNFFSNFIVFLRCTKASQEEVENARNIAMRLCSLLNCLMIHQLEGTAATSVESLQYPVIDVHGIDKATLQAIFRDAGHNKVTTTMQCLQKVATETLKNGVTTVAPPIFGRTYQELSQGMAAFSKARKLVEVDFPAPYLLALKSMILIYIVLTPIAVIAWAQTILFSAAFSFTLVFVMFVLMSLAEDMDDPYDDSAFVFDKYTIQAYMNQALVAMLLEEQRPLTELADNAEPLGIATLHMMADSADE